MRGGAAGSAAVSVSAATWLLNSASVPLAPTLTLYTHPYPNPNPNPSPSPSPNPNQVPLALYDALPTGPRIALEPGMDQAHP